MLHINNNRIDLDLAILYACDILGDLFTICIVVADIFARHNAIVISGSGDCIGLFSTSRTKVVVDNDGICLILLLNWLNRSIVADGSIVGLGTFATFALLTASNDSGIGHDSRIRALLIAAHIIWVNHCHRRLVIVTSCVICVVSAAFVALAALTGLAAAKCLSLEDAIVQLDATAIGLPSSSQFASKVAK